jgi:hypothetical protein
VGGFIVYMALSSGEGGVALIVGGAFALAGLLVAVFGGVHQLWARSQTAETFFEMDTLAVKRGEPARFCVVQPGPADFQSLRVKVVCERTLTTWRETSKGRQADRDVRLIHDHCALDLVDIHVARGAVWRHEATLIVPRDQPPSGDDNPSHVWQVEIWGCVRRGPDVMHPFVIDVD